MSDVSAASASAPVPFQAQRNSLRGFFAGAVFAVAVAPVALVPGLSLFAASLMMQVPSGAPHPWIPPEEWCAAGAGIFGIAAAWTGCAVRPRLQACVLAMAAAGLAVAQMFVFRLHGVLWEPFSLLAALGTGFTASMLLTPRAAVNLEEAENPPAGAGVGAEKHFRERVGRPLRRRLLAVEDAAFLQPAQHAATAVTCRLLNDNTLRENLPARDFLILSEAFRLCAGRVLMEHGGCLDAAESSGVRAFFGLPLPSSAAADEAAAAALALDEELRRFSVDHMQAKTEPPVFGIGIASGTLTAGVSGENYSVLGDAVEISRWLAAENTNYHSRILMDERTRLLAAKTEDRPLEISNPPEGSAVEIFQLLGLQGALSTDARTRRDAFRDAIMLLRAGHAEDAMQRFEAARSGLLSPDLVLECFLSQAQDQARRDNSSSALTRRKNRPIRKMPRHP